MKKDPGLYVLLWMGIIFLIGLVIAGLLALALATPAGLLIAKLVEQGRKTNIAANFESE